MCLFIYGNRYEGGGFLFYTLTGILFNVLYFIILLIAGYFSIHAPRGTTGLLLLLIPVTALVHRNVHNTFIVPSRILSLAKARHFDAQTSNTFLSSREEKLREIERLQQQVYDLDQESGSEKDKDLTNEPLLPMFTGFDDRRTNSLESSFEASIANFPEEQKQRALDKMRQRYSANGDDDNISDFTDSEVGTQAEYNKTFFIYRQPSLNRGTWEIGPRPYRCCDASKQTRDAGELWR